MREHDRLQSADEDRPRRDEQERIRSGGHEPGPNFEQQVSDINNDPDAGFDFDVNPTDGQEGRQSER